MANVFYILGSLCFVAVSVRSIQFYGARPENVWPLAGATFFITGALVGLGVFS
jgi:hypothetical protein